MEQQELFDITSPCIQVCEMDKNGFCKGCLRNRKERDLWFMMTESQKRQVLRLIWLRKLKRHRAKIAVINENTSDIALNEDRNLLLFTHDVD